MERNFQNRIIVNRLPSNSINKKSSINSNKINPNDMIIINEKKKSPYSIIRRSNVSSGIGNNDWINNYENSKGHLESENKLLREKLALKEKELFQKDKVIKDLQDKITKLEIENRNLKREAISNTNNTRINSNNILLSSSNNISNSNNQQNHRRIGSNIRSNDSNNIRSVITDSVRNTGNNNNNNANNRELRSFSNNQFTNRINNNHINNNNYNRNNDQIRNANNNLIYQDDGLFPFINEGVNNDIEFPEFLLNNTLENNVDLIDPVREVEDMLLNELCPNPDQMTYEQLLEFQDKIGYVEKGFTKKEIEKLPKIKYSKPKFNQDEEEKCTVCQYDFKDSEVIRKLKCGHLYHLECVDEWLLKSKKCPVCKMETRN